MRTGVHLGVPRPYLTLPYLKLRFPQFFLLHGKVTQQLSPVLHRSQLTHIFSSRRPSDEKKPSQYEVHNLAVCAILAVDFVIDET